MGCGDCHVLLMSDGWCRHFGKQSSTILPDVNINISIQVQDVYTRKILTQSHKDWFKALFGLVKS